MEDFFKKSERSWLTEKNRLCKSQSWFPAPVGRKELNENFIFDLSHKGPRSALGRDKRLCDEWPSGCEFLEGAGPPSPFFPASSSSFFLTSTKHIPIIPLIVSHTHLYSCSQSQRHPLGKKLNHSFLPTKPSVQGLSMWIHFSLRNRCSCNFRP